MVKKVVLIVLGLILFIVGLAIAAVGGVALGFGGRSGIVQSSFHAISTPTSAFVSDPAKVRNSNDVNTGGSNVTIRVDGRNSSKPLFIGVGPTSQVNAYLNGVSYDRVTDVNFGNFRLDTTRVNGAGQPAAPGDQSFWVASASGANPQMNWKVSNGDYRVVVMNADGSPRVALEARAGLKIKNLFGIGIGAVIAGAFLALLGLALLIWGIAAKRKIEQPVGYPGPYPPPGYPAGYPPTGGGPPGGNTQQYPAQPPYQPPPGPPPPPNQPPTTTQLPADQMPTDQMPTNQMPTNQPPPPPGSNGGQQPPGGGQPGAPGV